MLSAKIKYTTRDGKKLVSYESGNSLEDFIKIIRYEVIEDVNLLDGYVAETIDENGNVTRYDLVG